MHIQKKIAVGSEYSLTLHLPSLQAECWECMVSTISLVPFIRTELVFVCTINQCTQIWRVEVLKTHNRIKLGYLGPDVSFFPKGPKKRNALGLVVTGDLLVNFCAPNTLEIKIKERDDYA